MESALFWGVVIVLALVGLAIVAQKGSEAAKKIWDQWKK